MTPQAWAALRVARGALARHCTSSVSCYLKRVNNTRVTFTVRKTGYSYLDQRLERTDRKNQTKTAKRVQRVEDVGTSQKKESSQIATLSQEAVARPGPPTPS